MVLNLTFPNSLEEKLTTFVRTKLKDKRLEGYVIVERDRPVNFSNYCLSVDTKTRLKSTLDFKFGDSILLYHKPRNKLYHLQTEFSIEGDGDEYEPFFTRAKLIKLSPQEYTPVSLKEQLEDPKMVLQANQFNIPDTKGVTTNPGSILVKGNDPLFQQILLFLIKN